MAKNIFRFEILESLSYLTKSYKKSQSKVIQEKVIKSDHFKNAKHIGAYLSMESEVETDLIIKNIFDQNKVCYLPRVLDKKRMDFFKINSYEEIKTFPKSNFGVIEPPIDGRDSVLQTKKLDLIIVPGLGFDNNMNRLGRGKGYYDIYISKLEEEGINPTLVGICFKEQIIKHLPVSHYDQQIDFLFSNIRE